MVASFPCGEEAGKPCGLNRVIPKAIQTYVRSCGRAAQKSRVGSEELLGDDLHRYRHFDLGVQADSYLMDAERLDGIEVKPAPIQMNARLGLDRLGHVDRGD